MPTASVSATATIAGLSIMGTASQSEDSQIGHDVTLAAAKGGTLTTRTDDDTGAVTLSNGHGIITGVTVDLYWTGGMRRGVTVGTVAGNVVPVDGGTGDNLPTQSATITVCQQTVIDSDVDGSLVSLVACGSDKRASIDFQQANGTSIFAVSLEANGLWYWAAGNSDNPLDATVGKIAVSHADTSSVGRVKIGILYAGV